MIGLKEARDVVLSVGNFDTKTQILLIKALRKASVDGYNAGKFEGGADAAFGRGFDAGYKKAMVEAEAEFQQRAIDYVVGCMKTADEVLKRVA